MANNCNRKIVEKYIYHKLSKGGFVWATNGSPAVCRWPRADDIRPGQDRGPADPLAAIHRVLREAGDELERLYQPDFTEMSRQLYLSSTTAQRRFADVIDELFRDGVNWGRIIAFFEFGGTVCVECATKDEMTAQVDTIAAWMTEYLNRHLDSWIQENGGWEAFVELYDRRRDSVFSCSWPSIKTVFGLAALGAASLTIGAYLTQK